MTSRAPTPFSKMHGLGNDFIVIDARAEPCALTPAIVRALADRRTGIGCDQLILIEPSMVADARMRIWNPDGSEVEACGNASRCVATLLGANAQIETAGGIIATTSDGVGASVDMGEPRFDWDSIPLAYPMDTRAMPVGWEMLERPQAVNVGNPHVIFFVDDVDAVPLERIGPTIENDPVFPQRVNVNVAGITGTQSLSLRVWERGAGLTLACGTGACATVVAALRAGVVRAPVTVHLPGGALDVDWSPGGSIRMTGPATHVFDGIIDWTDFAR